MPIVGEETQHKILRRAVQTGAPTSVIITNVKKGGEPFYNLISLKPVNDKDGNYVYNIGIQMEITTGLINIEDIQNVIDLMHMLSKIKVNVRGTNGSPLTPPLQVPSNPSFTSSL